MKQITVYDVDVFQLSGPKYICDTGSPWSHPDCKRVAMVCLVQAVYALQKDRDLEEMRLKPLAPDWWLPFKYKLVKVILDDEKGEQIVGAVFKWNRRLSILRPAGAPKVVVAFRGTMPRADTFKSDLKADFFVMMLKLHTTVRFSAAVSEIERAIARYGVHKVCITGHSLGSAVCLMAGRTLAERGYFVDTHLFNPPFPSFSEISSLKFLHRVIVKGLTATPSRENAVKEMLTAFTALRNWQPHLYVNSHDPICSSYITYFDNTRREAESNKSSIEFAASQSLRALLRWLFGDAKPFHLLPCARLYVVRRGSKTFRKAHGVRQWWELDTEIESRRLVVASP